jgi:hypothetical protein
MVQLTVRLGIAASLFTPSARSASDTIA